MIDYPQLFKLSYAVLIIPTVLVIVSAWLSAKEMGGTLGQGLKKIAIGSIFDSILVATFILVEGGSVGLLNEEQVNLFFAITAFLGASFLVIGYIQIYRISRKLKLFTIQ